MDPTGQKKESWKKCNRRDVEETKFTVEDLTEGGEYEFRVKAVNEAGISKPCNSVGPIIVKDQTCKYLHNYIITDQCTYSEFKM